MLPTPGGTAGFRRCAREAARSRPMIPLRDDNPTTLPPIVTVSIIVACTVTFLWQVTQGDRGQQHIVYALGVIPAVLFGKAELPPDIAMVPPEVSVLTSMFLHGGWLHLIGN